MEIICPSYVNTALRLLEVSGFKAYAVGGCVRDSIMGREPNDWDMTTSALPDEIQKTFAQFKTIPTGIKHGTITVIIEGKPLEITTMRIDGEYQDNRRPETVEFTDEIAMDLSRRDFTANAMAYNPNEGIVDPYGGRDDIKKGLIRCVGDPDKRFNEDALRIIRAMRFASVLGFDIEKNTAESIMKNRSLLENVANERIRTELVKLLCGRNSEQILTEYKEIVFDIIPELKASDGFDQCTPYHIYDVWTHTVKVVASAPKTKVMRVAALLHDVSKPECVFTDTYGTRHFFGHSEKGAERAKQIMQRLRFSNEDINGVCSIILLHEEFPDGNRIKLAKLCSKYSVKEVRNAVNFMFADSEGKNPEYLADSKKSYELALRQLDEFEREKLCLKIADLKVNGNDLKKQGIEGRRIKLILEKLLEEVIEGKISNEKTELFDRIKYLKNI